jgi:hypothetical protein
VIGSLGFPLRPSSRLFAAQAPSPITAIRVLGFEPKTFRSRNGRAAKLRYTLAWGVSRPADLAPLARPVFHHNEIYSPFGEDATPRDRLRVPPLP